MQCLGTDMTRRVVVQIALLIVGLVLMGAGILRGELIEIFRKGTVICMECIGIG